MQSYGIFEETKQSSFELLAKIIALGNIQGRIAGY